MNCMYWEGSAIQGLIFFLWQRNWHHFRIHVDSWMDMNRGQILRGFFLLDFLMQILYLTFKLLKVTDVLVLFLKLSPFFLHLFLEIFKFLNFTFDVFYFWKVLTFVLLLGLFHFDLFLKTFDLLFEASELFKILFVWFGHFSPGVLHVPSFRV